MQKKYLFGGALFVLMVAACGGPMDEGDVTTEEVAQDPEPGTADTSSSEDVAETSQALSPPAPSCLRITRIWRGACAQKNFEVQSSCGSTYNVRIDIQNFPDTSCRNVGPGRTVVFTSGCGPNNPIDARGIVRC